MASNARQGGNQTSRNNCGCSELIRVALALLLLAPGCRATELSEAQQTQVAIERDQPAGPLPTYVLPRTDVIGPLHAPAPGEGVGWNLTP